MVKSFPIFNIGDEVLNTNSDKKGTISFVHVSNLLNSIFFYKVIYNDDSFDSFVQESDLKKSKACCDLI
jgi:hypothetical protein